MDLSKSAVYFFAESTLDHAMWAGLAAVIREVDPRLPLVLIRTEQPEATQYQWDVVLERFDEVHEVGSARYQGDWSPRGLYSALRRGFPQARRVASQLRKVDLRPGSTAFVFSGLSLNQGLFLRRVQFEESVSSVLITLTKPEITIDEFAFRYADSLFQNMYLNYFGTAFVDVHWLRVKEGTKTRTRDVRFRNRPADLVFTGELPYRSETLETGHVYCPFYQRDRSRESGQQTVIVIGAPFQYEPHLDVQRCVARLNEILDVIRRKHAGSRLVYKPHPGENTQQVAVLDLRGIEVDSSASVEALVMKDRTISVAYAFNSISVYTTACLGVRSYLLYPLFDERCIPAVLRRSYDTYLRPDSHPEMLVTSIDDWLSGKNDYKPAAVADQVRASAIRMLETAGVVTADERVALIGEQGSTAVPEQRWQPMPEIRTIRALLWHWMAAFLVYVLWRFPGERLRRLGRGAKPAASAASLRKDDD